MRFKLVAGVGLACALLASAAPSPVQAGSYSVFVGYSDGLRGAGFFPSPWAGDPGVHFVGTGTPYDAGAIRIDNTGATSISVDDILVELHPGHPSDAFFDLWGSTTLAPGEKLIVTQTAFYNFDTSDFPVTDSSHPFGPGDPYFPVVTITVDGVAMAFGDTAHVLDTEGFDYASIGNESFAWRPIGTFGGPPGTPEPASLALAGVGLAGLAAYGYRRRKVS